MTGHTEIVEGETYTWERGRGLGGPEVEVLEVGVEYAEVAVQTTVGRRQTTETEAVDLAEAQGAFTPA